MKKIFFTSIALFAFIFSASSQEDRDNDNIQDKIQQEPPREPQKAVDRAARQANINEQNNRNVREAEEKLQQEKERSTGKPRANPAETNSTTVKPPVMSDPVSAPIKK